MKAKITSQKKKFQPITIEIRIETYEDLNNLFARHNIGTWHLKSCGINESSHSGGYDLEIYYVLKEIVDNL